jgi:phosphomannomutase
MDGTLTEARKKANKKIAEALSVLKNYATIGILSGSSYEYILEQCSTIWDSEKFCSKEDIVILPCNGTQMYTWNKKSWESTYSRSIKEHLGLKKFNELILEIINCHIRFTNQNFGKYPLSGNFISYRKSLINWSPIGRDSGERERSLFVEIDEKEKLRLNFLPKLKESIQQKNIVISLGGNTSFDIYPKGWDKTHALKHFRDHECWFVGDRCEKNGNDKAIYDILVKKQRAFKTDNPDKTIKIIEDMINIFEKEKSLDE